MSDGCDCPDQRVRACGAGCAGPRNAGRVRPDERERNVMSEVHPIVPILSPRSVEDGAGLADRVGARVAQVLKRSMHIRHLDAGSCNGCDWEIQSLLGPAYDIQRLGIDIVASPRHADALLVTGSVTRHLEQAARMTWEAMP